MGGRVLGICEGSWLGFELGFIEGDGLDWLIGLHWLGIGSGLQHRL